MDYCVECGKPLVERPDSARLQCCTGKGYWSAANPLPRDQWYPVIRRKGMTAYIRPRQ